MNALVVWGWFITFDLFLGGLSAGLFISVAGLEAFSPSVMYEKTLTWGATCSWIILTFGLITLILDLGHPERAVNTMLHPQLNSPMSWGSITIATFLIFSLAYWLAHTGFLIRKLMPPLWRLLNRFKIIIVIFGGIFAFMTGTYTGILLTYARFSLWNSPVLPLLFLVSALGTGYGLFLFLAKLAGEVEQTGLWRHLPRLLMILGVVELLLVLTYLSLLTAGTQAALLSLKTIYGTLFTLIFLVGGVLLGKIGLPLLGTKIGGSEIVYLSTVLVVFGGFILRYVIVFLGQSL
ncbi:MAG: NrfD/PsrC family molybdoenzyme membrane anchor subunit [Candidatus Heimdallarchaeota archaeon]